MNTDTWYAVRRAATAYRSTGKAGQLTGAVRLARRHGATWVAVGRAAGLSASTVRRLAA